MRGLTAVRERLPSGRRAWAVLALRLLAAGLVVLLLARLAGVERGTYPSAAMVGLPIWLAASYPLLVVSVLLRQRVLSWLALVLTASHVWLVAPSTGRDAGPCVGTPMRVVAANVLKFNDRSVSAGRALLALDADVLVLPEVSPRVAAGLQRAGLNEAYPYALADLSPVFETTALLSRLPLSDPELRQVNTLREPRATVVVGGVPVRVLGVHPYPPITGQGSGWQRALQDLDGELQQATDATVAAGDFNASRDLKSFRRLLDDGVRDAHEELGRGLAPTWPAGLPFLHLDHVLVKGGVSVCDIREVTIPGSDHLALVADLAVR